VFLFLDFETELLVHRLEERDFVDRSASGIADAAARVL
jgi:hypothetical protein